MIDQVIWARAIVPFLVYDWSYILTQLSQMRKLKNLKKLKPYALLLNIQQKRLLAITSNDRRE